MDGQDQIQLIHEIQILLVEYLDIINVLGFECTIWVLIDATINLENKTLIICDIDDHRTKWSEIMCQMQFQDM